MLQHNGCRCLIQGLYILQSVSGGLSVCVSEVSHDSCISTRWYYILSKSFRLFGTYSVFSCHLMYPIGHSPFPFCVLFHTHHFCFCSGIVCLFPYFKFHFLMTEVMSKQTCALWSQNLSALAQRFLHAVHTSFYEVFVELISPDFWPYKSLIFCCWSESFRADVYPLGEFAHVSNDFHA